MPDDPISAEEFDRRLAAYNEHIERTPIHGTRTEQLAHVVEGASILAGGQSNEQRRDRLIADAVRRTLPKGD
jgi:fructose-bisphosphate aldolase class 1